MGLMANCISREDLDRFAQILERDLSLSELQAQEAAAAAFGFDNWSNLLSALHQMQAREAWWAQKTHRNRLLQMLCLYGRIGVPMNEALAESEAILGQGEEGGGATLALREVEQKISKGLSAGEALAQCIGAHDPEQATLLSMLSRAASVQFALEASLAKIRATTQ